MVFWEALVLLTITISDGESSGPKRKDTVILLQGTICPPKPFLPFGSFHLHCIAYVLRSCFCGLETRVIIKISTHPCYPRNFDWFSWEIFSLDFLVPFLFGLLFTFCSISVQFQLNISSILAQYQLNFSSTSAQFQLNFSSISMQSFFLYSFFI